MVIDGGTTLIAVNYYVLANLYIHVQQCSV